MASGTFWGGQYASVTYKGTSYPFKKWTTDRTKKELNFTNFLSSGGYEEYQPGFKSATITLEGPIDTAKALPWNDDDAVTIITQVGTGMTATWSAIIIGDTLSSDVEDAGRMTVKARVVAAPVLTWGT